MSKKKKIILWLIITVILLIAAFFLLKDIVLMSIYPLKYEKEILQYAGEYQIDRHLVAAVIWAESSFDADAVSKKGAMGLMQIMPDTGEWIAQKLKIKDYSLKQLKTPGFNIRLGCWYLRYLNDKFGSDTINMLASYNAGPGKVQSWLNDKKYSSDGLKLENIPYEETKEYVEKITRAYEIYKSLYKIE